MRTLTYTDAELLALLDDVESDRVERKESWRGDAAEKSRQAICAFMNDLPGSGRPGVLFVGAKDDGSPAGLVVDDQLLLTLADLKTDGKTAPSPTLVVEKRVLKNAEMAVVTVQPADAPPVRFNGRIWIRTGPRRGIASAQDERLLNERRRYRDLPFDLQPVPSSQLSDLSRLLFEEEYLPNAFARDVLEANERTYVERLSSCRMIAAADIPTPTVLGLLVLGKSPRDWLPGAYIQFLRIQGRELADPIVDDQVINGSMGQMLRRINDKLAAHNSVAVELSPGPTEVRHPEYPQVAFQQLVYNAVLHRSYEATNAPVRVTWFDDRIEIQSPGGPFGMVTPEKFGTPGITDYRNPHLAEALRVLGFVQRFGVGLATAQRALEQNGNPPFRFVVDSANVLITLQARTRLP